MVSVVPYLLPVLLAGAGPRAALDPRIPAGFASASTQTVIVELSEPEGPRPRSGLAVAERARLRQLREGRLSGLKQGLLARLRAAGRAPRVASSWPSFRAMALEASPADLEALAADPAVARIHFNRLSRPLATTSFAFTGATRLHALGTRGAGTAVAVLDSAVRHDNGYFGDCPSPGAPNCAVAARVNFTSEPLDVVANNEGHGTNVAGIVLGMAPATKILSLNIFRYVDGAGYVSSLAAEISALQWMMTHAAEYALVAANMSLGDNSVHSRPCNDDPLTDVFRTLWDTHGVLITVASGNEYKSNGVSSPACISLGLTVAAGFDVAAGSVARCAGREGRPGDLVCFSNRSGQVDLAAPGFDIDAGGLFGMSGTSMAAPHVAGAIAVLQSAHKVREGRFASAERLRHELLLSAVPRRFAGWTYPQLRLEPEPPARDARTLARWVREGPENAIPTGSPLSLSLDVSGIGRAVAGTYLLLDVSHARAGDVRVSLTSPEGKTASFALPSGPVSNFVGVIGHTVLAGALSSLDGGPIDGRWTLELVDTGGGGGGALLEAALFWPRPGCVPSCVGERCGDDGCGGRCPACEIREECLAEGDPSAADPCRGCVPAVATAAWSPMTGTPCDDGNLCTGASQCVDGVCQGAQPVVCSSDVPCQAPGACNPKTGVCGTVRKPDGTACDDGNRCTLQDSCSLGACGGAPVSCPVEECRLPGACDPASGECLPGAPVEDGAACAKGTCKAGECKEGCGCSGGAEPVLGAVLALAALLGRRRRR